MSTDIQATPPHPRRASAAVRWRAFCGQWRHSYLLLAALSWLTWRVSALPIPRLEGTRIMGGINPIHVLLLMRMLELSWVPPLVAVVLYAASFAIPRLNTSSAIAVCSLSSSLWFAFVLVWTLICVGLLSGFKSRHFTAI